MKGKTFKYIILIFFLISLNAFIFGYIYKQEYKNMTNGFYLNGDDEVTLEYGDKYKEDGFTVRINGKNYEKNVSIETNLDENKIGEYKIKYKLSLMMLEKTIERTVKIVDTTPPTLTINTDKDIYLSEGDKISDIEYIATDNYDGDLTSKVKITSNVDTSKKGNYKIIYEVSDSSNNTISDSINVHVQNKFEHTYVKVSIKNQTLEYYQKNKVVFKTDVTTGRNNGTPTGNYKVIRKARNTYLMTKEYKTFVKYWIGFLGSSYGIHDASWRKKFGGKEYLTNGSHGCVNISTSAAEKLYSMIELGTPIYIRK